MSSISDVSDNLAKIIDMAGRLEARAVDRACDREFPGGDAMVLLAGVGSRHDWERRNDLAEASGDYGKSATEDPDKMWSALQTLWYWTEDYRQQLGMNYDDPRWRPTLTSEAGFLRNRDVADWIWNNEPKWDAYSKAVNDAKAKLENVLIEGNRSDRSEVICGNPDCDDPRKLIRVYARRHPTEWECDACGTTNNNPEPCDHCESDSLREVRWESDTDDDRWKCGACKNLSTDDEVQKFYAKQLWLAPAEKWMPIAHAVQLMREQGWQERVVRSWLDDLEVRTEDISRRREVLWSSLWRRHLLETQARKERVRQRAEKRQEAKAS